LANRGVTRNPPFTNAAVDAIDSGLTLRRRCAMLLAAGYTSRLRTQEFATGRVHQVLLSFFEAQAGLLFTDERYTIRGK
jgi:hypothetical protein